MRFIVPNTELDFYINGEVWAEFASDKSATIDFSYTFFQSDCAQLVPIDSIAPPLRDGNKIWFRDQKTVLSLLHAIKNKDEIPPIVVWGRGRKINNLYSVRDGFHRFYLSIAMGYQFIPIRVDDWDFEI